jgi:SAM-dependent methyltransferase
MRGAHIAHCEDCGVKFMNPQYSDAFLARYYAGYTAQEATAGWRFLRRSAQKEANLTLVEHYVRPGRLLSIGCGDGLELSVAKTRGWQPEGYDVDPSMTARVAVRVGVPVHDGDLFRLPLADASFDCVYLDQVLEHPKRPAEYLRLAHRLLRPDGVLFIGVPNIDSVSSTLKTAMGKAGLRRSRRGKHYDSWHHQFYYAPSTLVPLLERRFGFRVLTVRGDPKPRQSPNAVTVVRDRLARRVPRLDSSIVILAVKRHNHRA